VYKRQTYQIAESNRIEKIDSIARIESNRNFFPELECSTSACRPSCCIRSTEVWDIVLAGTLIFIIYLFISEDTRIPLQYDGG